LASAAVLALQVSATRVFSFLIWYHFAFLVISIAFLGFTAGGVWVSSSGPKTPAEARVMLRRLGLAAGVMTFVAFVAMSRLPIEPHLLESVRAGVVFLAVILATLLPFVCLGAYICLALILWSERISKVYAVNLAGSAIGCALVVGLLDWLGVPAAFLASGLLAFSAGLIVPAPAATSGRRLFTIASVLGWLLLIYGATDQLSPLIYMKSSKAFPHVDRKLIAERRSDSLSTVDVFASPRSVLTLWGMSPAYKRPLPSIIGFAIDGWALTSIVNHAEVQVPDSPLMYLPASVPYRIHPAKDVLVIGAGGGLDVATALYSGARHVTGVEINPIIYDSVKRTYAEFAGHLYDDPRVEMHVAEGRHFLKRDRRKYDIIQLSGVDTFAASQAGAFALHENYLYTVEAMQDYLAALKPDGILTFTRWMYIPERQTIRLAAIVDRALRERGVKNPQNHLAIFESGMFTVAVIKNSELTREQIARLEGELSGKDFKMVYAPFRRVNPFPKEWKKNPFYEMWDLGPDKFIEQYPLDIRPTTDDRPFFFEYQRWGHNLATDWVFTNQNAQIVLFETLSICIVLCAILLVQARRRFGAVQTRLGVAAHVYFAALGLGYIFVENLLVQRIILFLGSPAYALTVILFTLLLSSGIGSALAPRLAARRAPLVLAGVAVLLLAYAALLRPVLDALLGLDLFVRVVIAVLLISPLGALMGVPFPLAIAQLTKADRLLVPWAWVINGAASVLGSVITVMIAMTYGFNAAFGVAAGLYVCAALAHPRLLPHPQP
jgi:spermidine synthase